MSLKFVIRSNGDDLPFEGELLVELVTHEDEYGSYDAIGPGTVAYRAESWHSWGRPQPMEFRS